MRIQDLHELYDDPVNRFFVLEHGIAPSIREGRPYFYWRSGNLIDEVDVLIAFAEGGAGHVDGFMNNIVFPQCYGGWVAMKHPILFRGGEGPAPIPPDIRTDKGPATGFKGASLETKAPARHIHCDFTELPYGEGPTDDPYLVGDAVHGQTANGVSTTKWRHIHPERPSDADRSPEADSIRLWLDTHERAYTYYPATIREFDAAIGETLPNGWPHRKEPGFEHGHTLQRIQPGSVAGKAHIECHKETSGLHRNGKLCDLQGRHVYHGCVLSDGKRWLMKPCQECKNKGRCIEVGDDHHGVNVTVVHNHRSEAKYLFAPNETVPQDPYPHDHNAETLIRKVVGIDTSCHDDYSEVVEVSTKRKFTDAALSHHLRSDHTRKGNPGYQRWDYDEEDGKWRSSWIRVTGYDDIPARHGHKQKKKVKKPGTLNPASRVDCHPMGAAILDDPRIEIVLLVAEGRYKADAVLTALIREGITNVAVVHIPSVTLWTDCPDLDELVRSLAGRKLYAICDADGEVNPQVQQMMRFFSVRLKNLGHDGTIGIAAPPAAKGGVPLHVLVEGETKPRNLKGIDDFLAIGILMSLGVKVCILDDLDPESPWEGGFLLGDLIYEQRSPKDHAVFSDFAEEGTFPVRTHGNNPWERNKGIGTKPNKRAVGRAAIVAEFLSEVSGRIAMVADHCAKCDGPVADCSDTCRCKARFKKRSVLHKGGIENGVVLMSLKSMCTALGVGWDHEKLQMAVIDLMGAGFLEAFDVDLSTEVDKMTGHTKWRTTPLLRISDLAHLPDDSGKLRIGYSDEEAGGDFHRHGFVPAGL